MAKNYKQWKAKSPPKSLIEYQYRTSETHLKTILNSSSNNSTQVFLKKIYPSNPISQSSHVFLFFQKKHTSNKLLPDKQKSKRNSAGEEKGKGSPKKDNQPPRVDVK